MISIGRMRVMNKQKKKSSNISIEIRDQVVLGTQEGPRKREGRRVSETRGRRARRLRGGVARVLGPGGGARDAAPQASRTSQAGDFGEGVG